MADNEVVYKIRAEVMTGGEERLQRVKKDLDDIQGTDKVSQSGEFPKGNQPGNVPKVNKQDLYSKATDEYLKQVDSVTKGFSLLAKSIESPITLLGMLKEGLFNSARATAEKADMLQVERTDEKKKGAEKPDILQEMPSGGQVVTQAEEKADPEAKRLNISNDLKKEFRKINEIGENRQKDVGNRLSVEKNADVQAATTPVPDKMDDKDNLSNNLISNALGGFAKSLGIAGGALMGITAVAIGVDKALKKMNEATLAAGERMAMLQTTGNVAGAELDEYNNSVKGVILNSIPIVGELVKSGMYENVADWTAYQPFAKLIPGLLDYKYKTGSDGSGADIAKKVTDETGLETGYDFATRFKVLGAMSEYSVDNDAKYSHELLRDSRALGIDPEMLISLAGNAVRYNTDSFSVDNNEIMTSIEKTAMDTGLERSRYKELIRGFDDIIKRQLSAGVKVSVANVSEMAGVLGQAGEVWKGEKGLQVQMSMNERLMNAGNLTSDEDMALMQWTRGENESYHEWRLNADKGFTKERFEAMAKRFGNETGGDIVTGNVRLSNAFGISYTQADELRNLMIRMNNKELTDTERSEAEKSFQEKMNEIKEEQRPAELEYLEKINTTMENASVEASNKLGGILEILKNWSDIRNAGEVPEAEDYTKEIKEEIVVPHDLVNEIKNKEGRIGDLLIQKNMDKEVPFLWEDNLFRKFDMDKNGRLDNEEMQNYNKYLEKILEALNSFKDLNEIIKLLEGGIEVE